ncbi:Two domain fusion protein (ParB-like nuclease domain/HTH-type transcriptional regulator) [Desulfamplus magnetovallimortis]|uniref:Two domain fusion protein (ParB-like nuclease domain/HTH-type transcriptional regulator) n=1 Tax=Desulfamplus magnetovallimortis TaxID=1246637 RepID=A0A1W1HII3_9BACT|nr:Lrp/AsnC ligand binding domain-containing protein [Desulfamplus magnetovallimortis]SLM32274.1 Two domain fusion protein (ParB-like nuclease domain/HTH-type transcriptional regulator) [Desulfamplus magnetovallimortis]
MDTTSSKSMMTRLRDFFSGENSSQPDLSGEFDPATSDRENKRSHELKDMSSFEDMQKKEGAFDSMDRGVQTVPLDQIIGSVGRYQDFDEHFQFKHHAPSERFNSILSAMRTGKALPPVKLYQIKDEYYVLDGNHRVAAAKKLHHDEILATIIEFIPSSETLDNLLYREKMAFCDRTGLPRTISLTEVGQYSQLTSQIQEHYVYLKKESPEITFAAAARDWYRTIYQPFCSIIKRGNIVGNFSGRTVADLYVYISVGHWKRQRTAKYGIGLGKLIPRTMEEFREHMTSLNEVEYPEMKRGITAFVLMNVKGKQEHKVIEKLFELEEVLEIHSVHGDIDLLVKVGLTRDLLSSDAEIISNFVHEKMRQLNGVVTTKTLIPGFSRIK